MSAKAAEFITDLPVCTFIHVHELMVARPPDFPAAAAVGLLMHFGHIATATLDTLPTRISVVTINPITSGGGGGLITPAPPRRCTLCEHLTNPPPGDHLHATSPHEFFKTERAR